MPQFLQFILLYHLSNYLYLWAKICSRFVIEIQSYLVSKCVFSLLIPIVQSIGTDHVSFDVDISARICTKVKSKILFEQLVTIRVEDQKLR